MFHLIAHLLEALWRPSQYPDYEIVKSQAIMPPTSGLVGLLHMETRHTSSVVSVRGRKGDLLSETRHFIHKATE